MQTARALLELQQVDLSILRIRKAMSEIPQMAQIQTVRAKLKELARRTTKVTGLLKDQVIEFEDNKSRRTNLTHQVEQLTLDNDQLTDFRKVMNNNAELDRLAKRLEKIDFNQSKAAEEIERLQEIMDQASAVKEKLEAQELQLLREFKEAAGALKEELTALEGRREALYEELPADLISAYEDSCKAHGKIGVGELKDGACSGCAVQMQPLQMDQFRNGPDISRCPVCGRLIVVRKG